MFSMDELNEWERIMNKMGEFTEKNSLLLSKVLTSDSEQLDSLIEITYKKPSEQWTNKRSFYYYEINKALDYFNARKEEGYEILMKKVESE